MTQAVIAVLVGEANAAEDKHTTAARSALQPRWLARKALILLDRLMRKMMVLRRWRAGMLIDEEAVSESRPSLDDFLPAAAPLTLPLSFEDVCRRPDSVDRRTGSVVGRSAVDSNAAAAVSEGLRVARSTFSLPGSVSGRVGR